MAVPAAAAARPAVATDIADRNSRNASLTLALAQPGDTLLYLLLPLCHADFGVSLAEAGLLLAANRLVRIPGYGWVAAFYARRGPRAACLSAAIGSTLATLGYGVGSGVWVLLVTRLLWGLSFAAMNIATQALATAEPAGAARPSGRMRAMIAAGPVGGLWAARWCRNSRGRASPSSCSSPPRCSRSRSRCGCRIGERGPQSACLVRASDCRRGWIPGPSSRG